ncbi:MAG: spore coat protein CotJB [Erysipelotrichaceae bacterium]|nr:spore coat protein CotJB [Erysipelotrichaceae bacterium]
MNEYGFDYLNYINNIPNNMNYIPNQKANLTYLTTPPNITTTKKININPNINNKLNSQTLEPNQGFIRGNLFNHLYNPYQNYKPLNLNPTNEQTALLYQLMQYQFALTDLDLYLDTHPNDKEMLTLYNKYLAIEKQISEQYESKYGPLTLSSNYLGINNWNWKNSPWPWEGV